MIPKPLAEIEWADLEALKDSGREEDDTIEYKGSFSGSADYLALSDSQREKALKGIAKEAIAFLNRRGGDIIIGAVEAENEHPRIEALRPLENISATADRLAQALSATIEPYQAVLGVRAIRCGADDMGVIVIRAPASLRAPHRFTRDRECYIRRGRESVPMPMDEVQDLSLSRSMARAERNEILDRQFSDLAGSRFRGFQLDEVRSHFRICFVPDQVADMEIGPDDLSAFLGSDPPIQIGDRIDHYDFAFRQIQPIWRPQLRGRVATGHHEYQGEFQFCAKSIKKSVILSCDFAVKHSYNIHALQRLIVHHDWVLGFLANSITSIANVLRRHDELASGTLRLGAHFFGDQQLVIGSRGWERVHSLPDETVFVPDFEIRHFGDFSTAFEQAQADVCAIASAEAPGVYKFVEA